MTITVLSCFSAHKMTLQLRTIQLEAQKARAAELEESLKNKVCGMHIVTVTPCLNSDC